MQTETLEISAHVRQKMDVNLNLIIQGKYKTIK